MAQLRKRTDRDNKWELDYVDIDGTRYRINTQTSDKKIAELWLRKVEEKLSQAKLGLIEKVGRIDAEVVAGREEKSKSITLEEFKVKYEERCRYDLEVAEGTISLNNLALDSFIRIAGNKKLVDVTEEDVVRWKRTLLEEGKSKNTAAIYHRHLRPAFNRAIKYGLTKENPFEKVEIAKPDEKQATKDMAFDEVQTLLKTIDQNNDPRYGLYIRFLLYTGCRRGEILNLRWEDIDFEKQALTVYAQKTHKQLTLPINKALWRVIEKVERKEQGYIFQTESTSHGAKAKKQTWNEDYVTHHFKMYIRKAKLSDRFSPHSLRHTYATYLRERGIPLDIVQRLLGHSSARITEAHYDHSVALHFRAQADLVDFEGEKET